MTKMETVWIQNLKGFINGVFPADNTWKNIFIERLDGIDAAHGPSVEMSLARALSILARVHTEDNDVSGYVVKIGAMPDIANLVSDDDYSAAWGVVRKHLHLSSEPSD